MADAHRAFRPAAAGLIGALVIGLLLEAQESVARPLPGMQDIATASAPSRLPAEAQAQLSQLQAALQTAVQLHDALTAAKTLNQIAALWMGVGNSQNALEAYQHALAAAKLARNADEGVAALNGLGSLARIKGQPQEQVESYQRALEVATTQGVAGGKGGRPDGSGADGQRPGPGAKALDLANQALSVRRSMGDRAGEGAILARIASSLRHRGRQAQGARLRHAGPRRLPGRRQASR
jgi:tetratricopeptide (TPR) repeat protein